MGSILLNIAYWASLGSAAAFVALSAWDSLTPPSSTSEPPAGPTPLAQRALHTSWVVLPLLTYAAAVAALAYLAAVNDPGQALWLAGEPRWKLLREAIICLAAGIGAVSLGLGAARLQRRPAGAGRCDMARLLDASVTLNLMFACLFTLSPLRVLCFFGA